MVGRCRDYLTTGAGAKNTTFNAWRAYAAIPPADFAAKSGAVYLVEHDGHIIGRVELIGTPH